MNQRDVRRIANYCAAMLIRVSQEQGFGVEQELVDSLGLSEKDVRRIELEIHVIREELLNRIGRGRKSEPASADAQDAVSAGPLQEGQQPVPEFKAQDVAGKRYAVCPDWVTPDDGSGRQFINFTALAGLYGVDLSECLHVPPEAQNRKQPPFMEDLVWLHPQRDVRQYDEMREELARGDDAFKVEDPELPAER